MGELLYGHVRSIASGVTQIDSYDTNAWLNSLATTGGEQDSVQDGGGDIASRGFDYGTIERSGFNQSAGSYFFNATSDATTLFASLVWNLNVPNDTQPTAQLYNLDLALFDVTNGRLVADSTSTLDNTENVFFKLLAGNRYEMRVTGYAPVDSVMDYALAWRMDLSPSPVPLPSAVWLFGSGLAGITAFMRRCRSQSGEGVHKINEGRG
ncbi:MAG: PEP-CTERM sorting domain-containing protein [Nitrospira sp.]|mgnify:CR=1 FL=1